MEIIFKPRQSGKSYGIAQKIKKDKDSIVITATEMKRRHFIKSFNVNPKQVYTPTGFLGSKVNGKNIYIDEFDAVICQLFGNNKLIYGVTTPLFIRSKETYIKEYMAEIKDG